jgi:hypothetical protein
MYFLKRFKRCGTVLTAVTILVGLTASQVRAQNPDPLAKVLAQVGMTPDDLTFDYDDMSNYGGDEFVMPLFQTFHKNPLRIPYYVDFHAEWLLDNWNDPSRVVGFCSQRIGEGSRRGLIGDQIETYRNGGDSLGLAGVFDSLSRVLTGWHPPTEDESAFTQLSAPVQEVIATILLAALDTYRFRQLAFAQTAKQYDMQQMFEQSLRATAFENDTYDEEFYEFINTPRWKYLYAGAQDLITTLEWAADTLTSVAWENQSSWSVATPWGVIAVGTDGDDTYPEDDYLLIIDPDGNDTYHGGAANRSYDHPVSLLIDLAGNDHYESATDSLLPSFGAGVFGYACLIDQSGDDEYHGVGFTQGAGLFGVGCLIDTDGDDLYIAHTNAQGSGAFGIGILIDSAGNDTYETYLMSQGFGYTKGMGLLLDLEGNDIYTSNDTDIRYPSSQSPDNNDALSQGCGFGMRRDYIDGYSLAGGIGYLIDGAGDDQYSAGLFAQGCAYWYSIGVLWDRSGHDTYNGIWYVQGSGAHFGVGYLNDKSGDDHYIATKNMAQGAGHDFTIGFLLDEAGDDQHDAPNLSLGGGNANGIGIYWDKGGNDQYRVSAGTTLGRANVAVGASSLRDSIPTIGLFLDTGGGTDSYPEEKPFAKNGTTWTQRGADTEKDLNTEIGCGGDF